ncbi:hypothetical protein NRY95_06175 [Xanthomonas campestris pv. phormiicola]|nr:hypothetical protein [Xanthomonas campestris pv. phormiicola]UYC17542.1 hypothetical protein NRY95_06175 [Xanthomonas campestris pv. phormiicola]
MVRDTGNTQKAAADAFTEQMIAKAAAQGISNDHVFVTGHSLGGAVAEIEAARYGLRGSTYNGFGAADLIDGPPQPGCQLTNYRMAGDVVSAASQHDLQNGAASARATAPAAHDLDESVASAARGRRVWRRRHPMAPPAVRDHRWPWPRRPHGHFKQWQHGALGVISRA